MNTRIYEWGDRKNTTLVFLHGLGSTGLSFGELAKYLAEYHVVSLDIAGHGYAEPFLEAEAYQPSVLASSIKKVTTKLKLSSFILIGYSWGAHLALYYAKAYSQDLKSLILLDGGYLPLSELGSLDEELENITKFHDSVRFPSWDVYFESEKSEISRWSPELEEASRAQVKEVDGEIRLTTSIHTANSVLRGMYAEPVEEIFIHIEAPTLLLRSTLPIEMEDFREKASNTFKELVTHSEVFRIKNTSHDIYRDAPQTVAERIKDWIDNP